MHCSALVPPNINSDLAAEKRKKVKVSIKDELLIVWCPNHKIEKQTIFAQLNLRLRKVKVSIKDELLIVGQNHKTQSETGFEKRPVCLLKPSCCNSTEQDVCCSLLC